MASVPKYNIGQIRVASVPRVETENVNLRVGAESFGAGAARDLQAFGGALEQTGEQWQIEANKAQVRDAVNQARTRSREAMDKIQNLRGKDALQAYDLAKQEIDGIRKDAHKSMGNLRQQKMFDGVFDQMADGDLNRALSHQSQESIRYTVQTLDAENENELQDALRDPGQIRNSLAMIRLNTEKKLSLMGIGRDDPQYRQAMDETGSGFHTSMIQNFLEQENVGLAKEYLAKYRDEIDPRIVPKIEQKVDKQNLDLEIRDSAMEIEASGLPLSEQLKKADSLRPEIAEAVRSKILQRNQQAEYAKREESKQIAGTLNKEFFQMEQSGQLSPEVIAQRIEGSGLDDGEQAELLEMWTRRATAVYDTKVKRELQATADETLVKLTDMFYKDPDGFLSLDLTKAAPILGTKDYEALAKKQADLKKGVISGLDRATEIGSKWFDAHTPQPVLSFGWLSTDATDEANHKLAMDQWAADKAAFLRQVQEQFQGFDMRGMTQPQIEAKVNEVLTPYLFNNWGSDETIYQYQLEKRWEERPEVPQAQRERWGIPEDAVMHWTTMPGVYRLSGQDAVEYAIKHGHMADIAAPDRDLLQHITLDVTRRDKNGQPVVMGKVFGPKVERKSEGMFAPETIKIHNTDGTTEEVPVSFNAYGEQVPSDKAAAWVLRGSAQLLGTDGAALFPDDRLGTGPSARFLRAATSLSNARAAKSTSPVKGNSFAAGLVDTLAGRDSDYVLVRTSQGDFYQSKRELGEEMLKQLEAQE